MAQARGARRRSWGSDRACRARGRGQRPSPAPDRGAAGTPQWTTISALARSRGSSSIDLRGSANHGRLRARSSNRTTPTAKRSVRTSSGSPRICSGAMLTRTSPLTTLGRVHRARSSARAMPKSVSFTSPSREMRTLCGVTSRWTRPGIARWTAPSARSRAQAMWTATPMGRRRPALTSGSDVPRGPPWRRPAGPPPR